MEDLEKITIKGYANIPLDQIVIGEYNVRKTKQRLGLEELKTSISNLGLIHPIIVVEDPDQPGMHKLIVGQRRYMAFHELEMETIPALIINSINPITEQIASFGENIHRRKLPYNDTIKVCDELFESAAGDRFSKIERISRTLGISISTVTKYLSYRLVPDEVRDLVSEGKLSARLAFRITSAFWPNTEKITNIANYMTKMTKSEWERALKFGKKRPDASVDEIIEEAKKPKIIYQLIIPLDLETNNLLVQIAEERKVELVTLVQNLIGDFLESETI